MLLHTPDTPSRTQPTNTFIGIRLPLPTARQLHADACRLCNLAGTAGNQRPIAILHVTMLGVCKCAGRLPVETLTAIDDAVSMVQFPAIDVMFDTARSFETRKDSVPFVLETSEPESLWGLRLAVRNALRVRGMWIPGPELFNPHVTLAYSRRRAPRLQIEPFRWKACDFQLIESWSGSTKYVELARWSLWQDAPPFPTLAAWEAARRERRECGRGMVLPT